MTRPARWLFAALALALAPAALAAPPKSFAAPLSRIAFGSCANQDKPLPIFDAIPPLKPELLILLGDNIYADLDKEREVTTAVIREKYGTLGKVAGWQKLAAACPTMATWDDHDYGLNDAGVEWPLKDESQKLFHDFFETPADSPLRKQAGLYTSATFGPTGQRVQVIMLDMRYFRSPLKYGAARAIAPYGVIRKPYEPNRDAGATLLGEAQWKWLAEELKKPAEVRLIGSSVQFVTTDHPFEKWDNIPAEREKFLQLIRDTNANGVIFLSGDRHLGELSLLPADEVGYPIYDLTSSGLNQANEKWRQTEANRYRVAAMPYGHNFGFIALDWAAADPTVSLQLRDVAGEVTLKQTFPISLLQAKGTPATKKTEKTEKTDKPAKEEPKLPEGYITPADAQKKVGEEVKLQFTVKSGRAVNDGKRILLNSEKDYRAKDNFTVVVNAKAMTGKFDKATYDTFKDKVIRVTGKVTQFKEAAQIQVDEEKALEIVEEK